MQRIKSFTEFISEELRDVITDISKSGRTKTAERIWTDPTSAKSPSSATLLKSDLRGEEFNDIVQNISNNNIKKMLLKHKNNPKVERLAVTLNNIEYLKDKLRERGELRCEYCNKGPLVVYDIGKGSINPGYLYSNQTEVYNKKDLEKTKKANHIVNGTFKMKDGATVDHKQPQSKGGDKFSYNNLAVCCYWCNQKKGNMTYEDWMNKIGKPVLESKKIEKEDVDNILIDLKDDFPYTRFYGFGKDGFSILDKNDKHLNMNDYYRLDIRTDEVGGNESPVNWSIIRPYIEEFIDRASDLGLIFKKCQIFQDEINGNWSVINYSKIPSDLDILGDIRVSKGLIGWVTVDFYIR